MKKLFTLFMLLIYFSSAVYAQGKGKGQQGGKGGGTPAHAAGASKMMGGGPSMRGGRAQMMGGGSSISRPARVPTVSQPARAPMMQQRVAAPQRTPQRAFKRPEPTRPMISAERTERISERRGLRPAPRRITERVSLEPSIMSREERRPSIIERRARRFREPLGFEVTESTRPERPERAIERIEERAQRIARPERRRPERFERAVERIQERAQGIARPERRRPERPERAAERIKERVPEIARPERRPERPERPERAVREREEQRARVEPRQELTPAQERELKKSPEVTNINQFAQRKIAQNQKLKAQVRRAENTWRTNKAVRNRWYNDWKKYSYYHHHAHFNFDTFLDFAFFAPWYLFPFTFYSLFYDYYPVYLVPYSWFSYPIYWDYGYANEIQLIHYVEKKDFNYAIDRLERRLDILENELFNKVDAGTLDSQSSVTLRAKISEIIWLLNDLKQIIYDAQLPYRREDYLIRRIKSIKQRGYELMNYFKEYRD